MNKYKISSYQKQIIMGKILGDGHLETVNNKTFRLKIEHSYKQKEYVDWLYNKLKNLASAEPKTKLQNINGKNYKKYWFNTGYSSSFRFYYHQFYKNGKKKTPKLICRFLTPLTLAIWYMDDGSKKSIHHKAKIINTQSFDKISLTRLQTALKKNFLIKAKLRKQISKTNNKCWQIYIPSTEVEKFEKIIKKYILPLFKYKLG